MHFSVNLALLQSPYKRFPCGLRDTQLRISCPETFRLQEETLEYRYSATAGRRWPHRPPHGEQRYFGNLNCDPPVFLSGCRSTTPFLVHICHTFQGLLGKLAIILQIWFGTKWFCYQEAHYFLSKMEVERLQNYFNVVFLCNGLCMK